MTFQNPTQPAAVGEEMGCHLEGRLAGPVISIGALRGRDGDGGISPSNHVVLSASPRTSSGGLRAIIPIAVQELTQKVMDDWSISNHNLLNSRFV